MVVSRPSYGALPMPAGVSENKNRGIRKSVAYAVTAIGGACVVAMIVLSGHMAKRTTLDQIGAGGIPSSTPGLKSLLGEFLHQQGASAHDEAEVNKYYSSKKAARVQMLGELSGEFDPISDADSNYGRVLGLAHISRTNGVIPEDMDISPEEKAPTQMLAMPDRFIRAKKIAQLTNTKNLYGTNAAFMGKYDGSGQSTKASVQMLAEKPAPTNVWQQIGAQEPSAAANNVMRDSDDHGYKSPVQMLDEKPVPVNVWQQIGAQEPSAAANNAMHQSDDHGYKARPQQLYLPKRFHATKALLPDAGVMGTNKAFLGKYDGRGQSTKAHTQQLDDISSEFDPISDADSNYGRVLGLAHISRTNGVIPEDMDISPERKAPVQMLYDVDGPQGTDPNYASWKHAAERNYRENKEKNSIAAQIRAALPQ